MVILLIEIGVTVVVTHVSVAVVGKVLERLSDRDGDGDVGDEGRVCSELEPGAPWPSSQGAKSVVVGTEVGTWIVRATGT